MANVFRCQVVMDINYKTAITRYRIEYKESKIQRFEDLKISNLELYPFSENKISE